MTATNEIPTDELAAKGRATSPLLSLPERLLMMRGHLGSLHQGEMQALLEEAAAVLQACDDALSDWLHTYAADVSREDEARAAAERIAANGGTLAYIVRLRARIEAAQPNDARDAASCSEVDPMMPIAPDPCPTCGRYANPNCSNPIHLNWTTYADNHQSK